MPRYRKKPIVVDAIRWYPDPVLGSFDGDRYVNHRIGYDAHGAEYTVCDVGIHTREGFMKLTPGAWLVTGVEGEKYPVQDSIFRATYESAS